MAAIVVLGGFFYRRLDLLNSTAVAALLLLIWRPLAIQDSSFQLSFLAIGCIAGLALPWLSQTAQPYVRALRGWRDVTRDVAHEPRQIQFRIDLRALTGWTAGRFPARLRTTAQNMLIGGIGATFRIWELLVLTIALQIGMLPLMARDFHRITLAAPIVNLIAVPLTSAVVPLGFVTLGCALLLPAAIGRVLAAPLGWLTLLLMRVVQWFAHFPQASYRIPGPPLWLVILFFLFLGLLAVTLRVAWSWKRRAFVTLCTALAVCSVTIAVFPFPPKWSPAKLEVTVLDVGQGDSLFVVSPRGKTLLVDGGGSFGGFAGRPEHYEIDPGEDAVSPYLWSRGYRQIDVVALTHAHQDHVGGLIAVLQNFRVGSLWLGREATSPALAALERLARDKHIPIKGQRRGNSFHFDEVQGQFFWPEAREDRDVAAAKNNDSLVLRLQYGNRTILLPGDAEKDAEREMLAENEETSLSADVLKVGHHGGKNSTMPEFLAAVKPRLAVISVGEDNSYGHPSPELLERLEGSSARILRTDRHGAVHLLTDGEHMEISCFVACPPLSPEQAATHSGRAQAPDGEKQRQQQ
jgi:competence protein ComEC